MPLYVADYLRDTRKLTPAEHGAYLLLIMEYWTSGGLPGDDRQLARVVGMSPAEWRKAKPNVQGFFGNDWQSHKRIDVELAKSAEISSKRSASAKQKHSNSSANAQQEHTHAGATSQLQPQPPEKKETREAALLADHPGFDDFWRLWPNKVGKPAALKAFSAAIKRGAGFKAIMNGVENYIRDKPPDRPWLNPATFLNQNRWEDQPAQVQNGKTGNIIAASDKLSVILDSFDAGPRQDDGLRSATGPPHVRLLSQG